MDIKQPELLKEKGIYQLLNKVNGKSYIGSTKQTFFKRMLHHLHCLKNNKHKNKYLQHSWNKHGEENFVFIILEVIKDKNKILDIEQQYLDSIENLYNINRLATGIDSSNTYIRDKRRQTMLKRYADGDFEHMREMARNREPWNKGKKYDSTEHLKVPKKKKSDRKTFKNTIREILPSIEIYDSNMNLLGVWRSAKDIEEFSLTDKNNFPIKSRFSTERMGKPINLLQSVNINKSCKTGKPYKGLYFKFQQAP